MKLFTTFLTIVTGSIIVSATPNAETLKQIQYEKYNAAANLLANQNDAQSTFYLGYVQLLSGKTEEAATTFQKIAGDALGMVGQGWVELNKKNTAGAKTLFDKALTTTKNKDVQVMRFIGEAYTKAETKDPNAAIEILKKAVTIQKNNPDLFISLGDAYIAANDGGNSITQYEYAESYDGTSAVPNCKIGQVYYRAKNYKFCKDYLEKAISKDVNYPVAHRALGEYYYKVNQFAKAKESYVKFMELGEVTPDNRVQYANILFLGKDYNGAIDIINKIIAEDNSRNYLNRIIGYSYYETEKYQDALTFIEKFLSTQPKDKIVASDYEYYGKTLQKLGRDPEGIAQLEKAVELDTNRKDIYGIIADSYFKQKRYPEAAAYYEKKIDTENPSAQDWFNVGNSYYRAKDYTKADAAFTNVITIKPEAGTGYFWRAKSNVMLDPEQKTGSAKPFYEKYIEIAKVDEQKNKTNLIEAYNYMAIYNLNVASDKTGAKEYANKVLTLDATNKQASEILKAIQ